MAKENSVLLHGVALAGAKIACDRLGEMIRGRVFLKVIDRRGSSQALADDADDIRYATIFVYSCNEEILKVMAEIEQNDLVDVYGTITTASINRNITCPTCGTAIALKSNVTYISPLYICKREHFKTEEEAEDVLKTRVEVSNRATIIGNVCKAPDYYDNNGESIPSLAYQLAVPRTIRVGDETEENETDFPWVIARGVQATEGRDALMKGSMVYVRGHLRSKESKKKILCPNCNTLFIKKDFDEITITPHFTEYLKNCNFPDAVSDTTAEE